MFKTIKTSFRRLNWKLLLTIFLTLCIPVIYKTVRMHLIGDMPETQSFSMAGNLQWINVFFEVLEETFLLPLYFIFKRILDREESNRKITGSILMISIIYIVAIIGLEIASDPLLRWMSSKTYSFETLRFIRIEFAQRFFEMLFKIGMTLLIVKMAWKSILTILTIQTALMVILDVFMISGIKVSAKLGIPGIAIDDSITNSLLMLITFTFIFKLYKFNTSDLRPQFYLERKYLLQSLYSGIESLVRNLFFIFFVIKVIDNLQSGYSQGDFWTMNSFIWQWLLIPIFAFSKYINRTSAFTKGTIWEKAAAPFIITTVIIAIWFALIPSYEPFFRYVLNYDNVALIYKLVLISLGFYILFSYNEIIDKIFYGSGKSQYLLIQSLITNVIVYVPYYYLSSSMDIYDIAIMFGTGISVDSFITFLMFIYVINKDKINKILNPITSKWKRILRIRNKTKERGKK